MPASASPLWRKRSLICCLAIWIALWIAFGSSWIVYTPLPPKLFSPRPAVTDHAAQASPLPTRSSVSPGPPLPTPDRGPIPTIQYVFEPETAERRVQRLSRRDAVKAVFVHDWTAYKSKGWGKAEISPLTGEPKDTYGGWAATMVDALDTLYIMGLHDDFAEAVTWAAGINFSVMPEGHVSTFEATIRYLGGFLAAYDLSGDKRMLTKAVEVADLLEAGFRTPNGMPPPVLVEQELKDGSVHASDDSSIAGLGTMSLEYIRLAQVTGNATWYGNAGRIMQIFAEWQNKTRLPGLWPAKPINAVDLSRFAASDGLFHLGGDSDSMYEYLIKADVLLGGSALYEDMYSVAVDTIAASILYRPLLPAGSDVLLPGAVTVDDDGTVTTEHRIDHLACFAGGMLALGASVLANATQLDLARRLTMGCVEMYRTSPLGIMPDEAFMLACNTTECSSRQNCCVFNNDTWLDACHAQAATLDSPTAEMQQCAARLPTGILSVHNAEFKLRPEALESVFYLYRITGDIALPDLAWEMFEHIREHTHTEVASAAIMNVMNMTAPKKDEMESYWFAETLKYLYLIFSEPDLISLDDWVFNTEAHVFRRDRAE